MKTVHFCLLGLVTLILASCNICQAQDSLGMHHVATLDYWQGASDIQMVGNLAYVVSGSSGLHIVDLTNAANPQEIGRGTWYDWEYPSGGVYITGNRAYVATTCGCCAFDISDPTNPVQLARWWEDQSLLDIFVHDTVAIIQIMQEYGSIPVVADVSDLGSVQQIGDFGGQHIRPVGIVGDYIFMVGSSGNGLVVYDFSDPTQPLEVAQLDSGMNTGGTVIAEDYIYLGTNGHGIRIIDISNPLQPVEVDSFESGECIAVSVTGEHLVTYKYGYLKTWNIADPLHPVLEGVLTLTSGFLSFAGFGNLVCLGYSYNPIAVAVVDISNPAEPVQVSSFGDNGTLLNMTFDGAIAYIGGGWVSLRTISLEDPVHPFNLGVAGEHSGDIAVHGNYAYMTDRNHGVVVFDVSNPAEPESLHCTPGGCPQKIVTAGDFAYVISTDQGFPVSLHTYSLLYPVVPVQVNSLSVPYYTMGDAFGTQNGYLYLGASSASYIYLLVYSLTNPEMPQLVGNAHWSNIYWTRPYDLALTDNYAYMADYIAGMATLDITQPENPIVVAQMEGTSIRRVSAVGNTVITDGNSQINVLDMSDPTDPRIIGYYPTLEIIRDIRILGSYVITISSSEFRVYLCDALSGIPLPPEVVPCEFALYPAYPNPFNASTVLTYTIPTQGKITLTIYNLLGQKITTLYDATQSPGTHTATWNTSNHSSSIYFAQLKGINHTQTTKMMLIK